MIENSKEVTGTLPDSWTTALREHLRNSLTACDEDRGSQFYKSLGIRRRRSSTPGAARQRRSGEEVRPRGVVPGVEGDRELAARARTAPGYRSRRLGVAVRPARARGRTGGAGRTRTEAAPRRRRAAALSPRSSLERRLEHMYVHAHSTRRSAPPERALCCVRENYQTKGGVKAPPVLVPAMGGVTFIPFVNARRSRRRRNRRWRSSCRRRIRSPKRRSLPDPKRRRPPTARRSCSRAATRPAPPPPDHLHRRLPGPTTPALQAYMGQLMAPLNAALNKIAKERPAEPLDDVAACSPRTERIRRDRRGRRVRHERSRARGNNDIFRHHRYDKDGAARTASVYVMREYACSTRGLTLVASRPRLRPRTFLRRLDHSRRDQHDRRRPPFSSCA